MTTVLLGNPSAKEGFRTAPDGEVQYRPVEGEQITTIVLRDDASIADAILDITAPRGVWAAHSDEAPSWVASDDDTLATVLASHFGCPATEFFSMDELAEFGVK